MSSPKDHSVTIVSYCGTSLHTWLVFNTGESFSFIPPNKKCAITSDCVAILEATVFVNERRHDVELKFDITEAEYKRMIQKISELESDVTYALMPLQENEYNCVTACRDVLKAGDIDFLNDVSTPVGVRLKILRDPSYAEKDIKFCVLAVLPRASVVIVREVLQADKNNGVAGWMVGGILFAFVLFAAVRTNSFLSGKK